MHKSRIEWCEYTLNTVTGCRHGCPYCFASQMTRRFSGNISWNKAQTDKYTVRDGLYTLREPFLDENGQEVVYPFGFEPTLHEYRTDTLKEIKMERNVFVGSMADLFGGWVPDEWILFTLGVCAKYPQHRYMFLTKNPKRYGKMQTFLPGGDHYWYGTTVTTEEEQDRIWELPEGRHHFVSVEPILEKITLSIRNLESLDWIIVGAETGRRKGKVIPEKEWIDELVWEAENYKTPVFMKDSLIPIVGEANMKREFPPALAKKVFSKKTMNRLYATCTECGKKYRRSEMVSLYARVGRSGPMKTICTMCRHCYTNWGSYHKLNDYVDELYGGIEDEEEKLPEDGGRGQDT